MNEWLWLQFKSTTSCNIHSRHEDQFISFTSIGTFDIFQHLSALSQATYNLNQLWTSPSWPCFWASDHLCSTMTTPSWVFMTGLLQNWYLTQPLEAFLEPNLMHRLNKVFLYLTSEVKCRNFMLLKSHVFTRKKISTKGGKHLSMCSSQSLLSKAFRHTHEVHGLQSPKSKDAEVLCWPPFSPCTGVTVHHW